MNFSVRALWDYVFDSNNGPRPWQAFATADLLSHGSIFSSEVNFGAESFGAKEKRRGKKNSNFWFDPNHFYDIIFGMFDVQMARLFEILYCGRFECRVFTDLQIDSRPKSKPEAFFFVVKSNWNRDWWV